MKYIFRFTIYAIIFLVCYSVTQTLFLRLIPVTITPYRFTELLRDFPSNLFKSRSNWVSLDNISADMQKAVIATEDQRFFEHRGFDRIEIRNAIRESRAGKRMRGASTISQQTAKNVFCTHSRTIWRKSTEAVYTVLIETFWGKQRIMEVYLNVVETNPYIYGVDATARKFYGHSAAQLTATEAAKIATVLPSPKKMDLSRPSAYMQRRSRQIEQIMKGITLP